MKTEEKSNLTGHIFSETEPNEFHLECCSVERHRRERKPPDCCIRGFPYKKKKKKLAQLPCPPPCDGHQPPLVHHRRSSLSLRVRGHTQIMHGFPSAPWPRAPSSVQNTASSSWMPGANLIGCHQSPPPHP